MLYTSNEARVVLAFKALQNDENLSIRAAAKIYDINRMTLARRRNSKPIRRDIPANSHCLTDLEEQTIVQYITELATRAFPPTLRSIEDMANYLQREHGIPPVGKQ